MGAKKDLRKKENSAVAPALMNVVADKGATDAIVGGGEAFLDNVIDNDALRELPFIGSLVGLVKAGLGVREYLFMKKLSRFLSSLEVVSEKDREGFRKHILDDVEFSEKVGESVLLLLERADDMEKPELLGKAFAAFLAKSIDLDQFKRMATGIDRCLLTDLRKLKEVQYNRIDDPWGANLLPAGLVFMNVSQLIGGNSTSYPLTESGKLIREYCLA